MEDERDEGEGAGDKGEGHDEESCTSTTARLPPSACVAWPVLPAACRHRACVSRPGNHSADRTARS